LDAVSTNPDVKYFLQSTERLEFLTFELPEDAVVAKISFVSKGISRYQIELLDNATNTPIVFVSTLIFVHMSLFTSKAQQFDQNSSYAYWICAHKLTTWQTMVKLLLQMYMLPTASKMYMQIVLIFQCNKLDQ